jgi:hypothetical protein
MHRQSHTPLHLAPRPSRRLVVAVGVLHGLAATVAFSAPSPLLGAGALVLVAVSGWAVVRQWRHCARSDAAATLERDGAGRWWLETCAGERIEVGFAAPPVVSRPLVVLYLAAGRRRWNLVLAPDSVAPDALRRLRVALRTRG